MKAENPHLRQSQIKNKVFKMWKKSPENPMNQESLGAWVLVLLVARPCDCSVSYLWCLQLTTPRRSRSTSTWLELSSCQATRSWHCTTTHFSVP